MVSIGRRSRVNVQSGSQAVRRNLVAPAFDTARACIEGCYNGCSLHRFEPGDDLPEQMNTVTLFDQAEMSLDAGSDETHRYTAFSGSSRSSYAVCVVHGRARQIVIHHRRQLRNIDATRGDIGSYENPGPTGLEIGKRLGSGALTQFAVKGSRLDSRPAQFVRDVFGRVLGADEDQHPGPALFRNQVGAN